MRRGLWRSSFEHEEAEHDHARVEEAVATPRIDRRRSRSARVPADGGWGGRTVTDGVRSPAGDGVSRIRSVVRRFSGFPRTCRRPGTSKRSTSSAGWRTCTTGPRPGRPWCGRRTPRIRRESSCGARRTRRDASGNAIVEMQNPSNQMDLNIGWSLMREHLMREGDTWVGITIRPIAVDALKRFDPVRDAPVSFADPLPAGPAPVHDHRRGGQPGARAGVGHEQPGRRVAQKSNAHDQPAARPPSARSTASATGRPAAT